MGIDKKTFGIIKKVCGGIVVCCMFGLLVKINAEEITKDRLFEQKQAALAAGNLAAENTGTAAGDVGTNEAAAASGQSSAGTGENTEGGAGDASSGSVTAAENESEADGSVEAAAENGSISGENETEASGNEASGKAELSESAAAEAAEVLAKYASCTYFKNFTMSTMDGGTFGTDNLLDYKITVVNAWGPYCPSCLAEMPALENISNRYKDKGLQIVGLYSDYTTDDDDDRELAAEKAEATGVTYPILLGNEMYDLSAREMLNNALPGTWILDSSGNVLDFQASGKSEAGWEELFLKWLDYAEKH